MLSRPLERGVDPVSIGPQQRRHGPEEGIGNPPRPDGVRDPAIGRHDRAVDLERVRPAARVVVEQAERAADRAARPVDAERGEVVALGILVACVDHGHSAGRIGAGGHGPRLAHGCLARRPPAGAEHHGRLAEEPADDVVIVDGVHHHLEAGRVEHPWPGRPVGPDVDRDRHGCHRPDPAHLDHPVRGRHPLLVAQLLVHHEDEPSILGEVDQCLAGLGIRRERLLGEDVATRPQDTPDDLRLGRRGDRDVHHLDGLVGEQLVQRLVDACDTVPRSHVGGAPGMVVMDPAHDQARRAIGGQVGDVHDRPGADDGDGLPVGRGNVDPAGLGDRPEPFDHRSVAPSRAAGIR